MGRITFGIPEDCARFLKDHYALDLFVETGTFKGETARRMSTLFSRVTTIEKSPVLYQQAKENLNGIQNITVLEGDSIDLLYPIIKTENNILFWMDAHWCGGLSYGEDDECPLISELSLLFRFPNKTFIIMIDDARLFSAPPPKPNHLLIWPTLADIVKIMPKEWEIFEFEDVLYLLPGSISLDFRYFLQEKVTIQWQTVGRWTELKNKTRYFLKAFLHRKVL